MLKIAACQIDIELGDLETNFRRLLDTYSSAAKQGAMLVAFPECSLSGYCFNSIEEAIESAIDSTTDRWKELLQLTEQFKAYCVCGFLERDGTSVFNSAGILGPGGYFQKYRKVHTLVLGVDRFVSPGNLGFPVFDLPIGRLGVNICYDQRFPESARSLMLDGAQLIVVPTNEPIGASKVCDVLTRARAYENHVYYLWVNRVGEERGTKFMGATQLISPEGEVLFRLGTDETKIKFAEIDLSIADRKHIVRNSGIYELDLLGDRVPRWYGSIGRKKSDI